MSNVVAALLAAMMAASPQPDQASADPPATTPCGTLDAARQLLIDGKPAQALPLFEQCAAAPSSERSDAEAWKALLGIALSHDLSKRPLEAATAYWTFLTMSKDSVAPDWLERRTGAASELQRLEAVILRTHGVVQVTSSPPGATVMLNGAPPAATPGGPPQQTPVRTYAAAGEVTVSLTLAGHHPSTRKVNVVAGQRLEVAVTLAKIVTKQPPVDKPEPLPRIAPKASAPNPGPWVLIAVGAAGIVAGVALTGVTLDKAATYDGLVPSSSDPAVNARASSLAKDIETFQPLYWTLYGVGAALVAGGVIWMLTADDGGDGGDGDAGKPTGPTVDVGVGPAGAKATIRWSF